MRSESPLAERHRDMSDGRRLVIGAWCQAVAGAAFVLYGISDLFAALQWFGFDGGQVTRQLLQRADPQVIAYVTYLQFMVAVFAVTLGVGMAAIGLFGVRRGQWWAWVTGVLGCAVLVMIVIGTQIGLGRSWLDVAPILAVAFLHATGSALSLRFLR